MQLDAITITAFILVLVILFGLGVYGGYAMNDYMRQRRKSGRGRNEIATRARSIERERLRKIFNLTSKMSETLNYNRVLDAAMDSAVGVFFEPGSPKNSLVCGALLFSGQAMVVQTSRQFTPPDTSRKFPAAQGILAKVVESGVADTILNPGSDPELSKIIAMRTCKSAYCIPLRTGLDVYGVLVFGHPEPGFFAYESREIIDIIAAQAMASLQNARLYEHLEEEKYKLVEIQEEARKKLARDLHDGPTQTVAAIAMRVNFTRRLLERNPAEAANELFKIEDMARRTTKEIRTMLFTLRPLVLESQGLTAALQQMADKMNETYQQNVLIEVDESVVEELEINKQGIIFQIAEEAVNNARKHAQAAHIWVRLTRFREELGMLQIQDDGLGFDVEAVHASYESRGSLGLVNLRERAEMVRGILQLDSKPGKGTNIQVLIPLSDEAAEKLRHGT